MAAVPFGFGVGDFFAVGSLALKLFYAYKEIPSNFKSLCDELFKVSVTLNDLEKDLKDPNSLFRHFRDSRKESLKKTIGNIKKELLKLREFRERNIGITTGDRWKRIKQTLKGDFFSEKQKVLQDCMREIKLYKAEAATASMLSFDSTLLGLRQEIAKALETQTRILNQDRAMLYQVMEQYNRITAAQTQFLKPPNSAIILSPKQHRSEKETEERVDGIINAIGNNRCGGIRKEELEENREFIRALVECKDESTNSLHLDTSSCYASRSASPATPTTPSTPLSSASLMDYIEEKQEQERIAMSRPTTPLPEFKFDHTKQEEDEEDKSRLRELTPALSEISLMDYIREKQEEERAKESARIGSKQKQSVQARSEQKQGFAYIHERREQDKSKGKDWMTEEPKQGVTKKRTWEIMEEKDAALEGSSDVHSKRRKDTINMTLRPKPPRRKNSMPDYATNQKKGKNMRRKREQEDCMRREEDIRNNSEDNTQKTKVENECKNKEQDTRKKKAREEEPKIGITRKRTLDAAEEESEKAMHVKPGQRKKASVKTRKHKACDDVLEVEVGFKFFGKLLLGRSVDDIVHEEAEKAERKKRR